ncbi:MAG: undecaprenyldiphospho-muramoylpentapeptide beta-N-acetylglucosaminyltransferase [Rhodobiaceae bacterium]|nr:MAG: undecaprenyldiphospho-muramoylpentapeptide beta-N-acetylglucosaminyltransferase [Rhodobiaceae bacterium]
MIAAGGTGGHLFPGQALSQELGRRGHKIVLITDERVQRFDQLFPGADIFSVPAATFSGRGLSGLFGAAGKIIRGTSQSLAILGRAKPSLVIGFGGYPTLPPMLAAILRRVPTIVHEQNAVLGRVNKVMAPFVHAIASTFPAPRYLKERDAPKLVVTGNPVRDAVLAVSNVPYEAPAGGTIRLLVFGGSQGARVMSDVVPLAIAALPEGVRRRLVLTQQCRPEDVERVRAVYEDADVSVTLSDFFANMPEQIAQSHLVIGRAGASTVSELSVIGRPSILVPLPHSLDQDQKANAEILSTAGAAWMMEQNDFTAEVLSDFLAALFADEARLIQAAEAAKRQGKPNAVEALADLVERTARRQTGALNAPEKQDTLAAPADTGRTEGNNT